MSDLLKPSQVAQQLGEDWSEYRVRAEVGRGMFPHRRVGERGLLRFTQDDIKAYLDRIAVDTRGGLTPGSQRRRRSS